MRRLILSSLGKSASLWAQSIARNAWLVESELSVRHYQSYHWNGASGHLRCFERGHGRRHWPLDLGLRLLQTSSDYNCAFLNCADLWSDGYPSRVGLFGCQVVNECQVLDHSSHHSSPIFPRYHRRTSSGHARARSRKCEVDHSRCLCIFTHRSLLDWKLMLVPFLFAVK